MGCSHSIRSSRNFSTPLPQAPRVHGSPNSWKSRATPKKLAPPLCRAACAKNEARRQQRVFKSAATATACLRGETSSSLRVIRLSSFSTQEQKHSEHYIL